MGARGRERVVGALPGTGHFANVASWSMGPGAMGKPCSILPALFPRLSCWSVAVGFERKVLPRGATSLQTCTTAKQTAAAAWSRQAHCLTHGKTSNDFSLTGRFKSPSKCPLAINFTRIFLRTYLLTRSLWK